jgi:hypothetical protein
MSQFCKLKTGEVMVVWSDNEEDDPQTMHLYPLGLLHEFDVEVHVTHVYPYSVIEYIRCDIRGNAIQENEEAIEHGIVITETSTSMKEGSIDHLNKALSLRADELAAEGISSETIGQTMKLSRQLSIKVIDYIISNEGYPKDAVRREVKEALDWVEEHFHL